MDDKTAIAVDALRQLAALPPKSTAVPQKYHGCEFCSASFTALNVLSRHVKYKHPDRYFDKQFIILCAYYQEFNKLPMIKAHYRGTNIGSWVSNIRLKKHQLSPDKVQRLNNLPWWNWTRREMELLLPRARKLRDFIRDKGRVPTHQCVYHSQHVGAWVARYRRMYDKGLLCLDEIQVLNSVSPEILNAAPPSQNGAQVCMPAEIRNPACAMCLSGIPHSCVHVMNFNKLKCISEKTLFQHAQMYTQHNKNAEYILYMYWGYHLSKNKAAPMPYPCMEYLRDVMLKMFPKLVPYRMILTDQSRLSEELKKLPDPAETIAQVTRFAIELPFYYNFVMNTSVDDPHFLRIQYETCPS